jgi:hypothetical protein
VFYGIGSLNRSPFPTRCRDEARHVVRHFICRYVPNATQHGHVGTTELTCVLRRGAMRYQPVQFTETNNQPAVTEVHDSRISWREVELAR